MISPLSAGPEPVPAAPDGAYEALMQFLYRAPVGLAQVAPDGQIEMINPMAAQLLMPLSANGNLDNLFVTLEIVAPALRHAAAAFDEASGLVCDGLRLALDVVPACVSQVLSISLLKLDETRLMAMLSDVTAEVQREHEVLAVRLRAAARVDALTQMPNRAAMRDLIQEALQRSAAGAVDEFAVLFMNCDRFKQINDTLGPAAGDEVLGLVSERLRTVLRLNDQVGRALGDGPVAARVGGDEFVVLLDGLQHPLDVHTIAGRLLEVLGRPYVLGAHELHCGISMGVLLGATARGDADAVLRDASLAMAEAKAAGGARYALFEPGMRERAARRGGLEAELRCALHEHELFVMYQPVVAFGGSPGQPTIERGAGVEALVRWKHPTRGVVPPLEFVGVAEECGLIGELGIYVLETACRQFMAWQRALGSRAPRLLAVNLSRGQLGDPDFVAHVRRILQATAMAAGQLQLEVTESLAAQGELVQARLHELKALGVSLALDDFGTGYSSLASLHLLPVSTVKIDRSFVSQSVDSEHHRVLIEATVRVANSLRMSTVAEGIETEAQAAVARGLGCHKGQGHLFSRPLLGDQIPAWLNGAAALDPALVPNGSLTSA